MPRVKRDQRGFAIYGDPMKTDYGHTIRVKQSSAAMGVPKGWMFVDGNVHVTLPTALADSVAAQMRAGAPGVQAESSAGFPGSGERILVVRKASMGVHLTPRQARSLIARLQAWVDTLEESDA